MNHFTCGICADEFRFTSALFLEYFQVCITMAKDVNDRMAIEIRGDKVIRATALFIEKIILEVAFTT